MSYKRRNIIQALREYGFEVLREGRRHTIYSRGRKQFLSHATVKSRRRHLEVLQELLVCRGKNLNPKSHKEHDDMEYFTIEIQRDGNFFVAQCLEEESCFTQGKTLQETIRNMREVLELMLDVKDPQLEVHLRRDAVGVFA